jgi:hypothetical protein
MKTLLIIAEPRPDNAKVRRRDMEFAPIKGRSTLKDAKRAQREDNRQDKALAKRNKVRFKGG